MAGVKKDGEKLMSKGGRVLGVVAVKDTLKEAIDSAYGVVEQIEFSNGYYRLDIGKVALKALCKE